MSDTEPNTGTGPTAAPLPTDVPTTKLFTLNAAPATVPPIRIHLPALLPGHEPFVFTLRLTFSEHMQKKRDSFLMLAPVKQVEVEDDEILNEVCDLLAQDPVGFGDYSAVTVEVSLGSPGNKFRAYYRAAEKASPQAFAIVKSVTRAANNSYWATVTPREFFPPSTDNGAGEPQARQANS